MTTNPAGILLAALLTALPASVRAQTGTTTAQSNEGEAQLFEKGVAQYKRTCQQCHGREMINSGVTVYDLRRFPQDDRERFFNSVMNGKGNMPSFKDALTPEQIGQLWVYVKNRGKQPS